MADRSVSIRLGTTGKADVTRAFDEIGASGDASAKRWANAFRRANDDVEAAMERQARAQRNIEKLMPGLNPTKLDMLAGSRDTVGKSAQASASVFTAAYDQMERRVASFAAALDPAVAAQQRFDREMAEARSLISAGAISLDQYVAKLGKERAALDAATGAQGRAAVSAGAHRAAMQGLSFQAQDAFTQISMGTNPLNVLAVQGAQAAGQMANMGGKMGAVATVLAGPWGLAVSGGLLLLGALTDRMADSAEAAEKKKGSVRSLTESIDDLNEATGRQIKSEQQVQAETLRTAGTLRQQALDARAATVEKLRLARAAVSESMAQYADNGMRGSDLAIQQAQASASRAKMLDAQLKEQEQALAKAQITFRQAEAPILARRVAESFDASAAATGRYDRAVDRLNQRYADGKVSQADYTAQLTRLTATRNRDTEAARRSGAASTAGADADALAASASNGLQRAQANLAQVRAAARAELKAGTITQAEYTARIAEAQRGVNGARDATREHAKATRDAATAQRELDSDLADVTRRFDPARAAAESYAETLTKIATIGGAGKRTRGETFEYTFQAVAEENDRRAKRQLDGLKQVFGGKDDPLADVLGDYSSGQSQRIAAMRQEVQAEQQQREEGVRKLAGLYEGLFSGGNRSIWQEFQDRGRAVIADLLAKWTMRQIDGAGGTGFLGAIGKLLGRTAPALAGGIGAAGQLPVASSSSLPLLTAPKLASGTEYWAGGVALLGENGMEAAHLPRGTRVSSAAETRRMLGANDNASRGAVSVNVYANDAVLAETVRGWVAEGVDVASTRGAAGGAALGRANSRAAAGRRLGRR